MSDARILIKLISLVALYLHTIEIFLVNNYEIILQFNDRLFTPVIEII